MGWCQQTFISLHSRVCVTSGFPDAIYGNCYQWSRSSQPYTLRVYLLISWIFSTYSFYLFYGCTHLTFRVTTVLNMISYHPNVSLMIQKQTVINSTAETALAMSTFLSQSFGKSITIFTFSLLWNRLKILSMITRTHHLKLWTSVWAGTCCPWTRLIITYTTLKLLTAINQYHYCCRQVWECKKSFSFLFVLFQNVLFFRNKTV